MHLAELCRAALCCTAGYWVSDMEQACYTGWVRLCTVPSFSHLQCAPSARRFFPCLHYQRHNHFTFLTPPSITCSVHLKFYVPLAMGVLAGLSVAPPVVSFLVLWSRRDRLHEVRTRKVGCWAVSWLVGWDMEWAGTGCTRSARLRWAVVVVGWSVESCLLVGRLVGQPFGKSVGWAGCSFCPSALQPSPAVRR